MSRVVKIHCTEPGCRNWATTDQDHSRLAKAGWRTWRTEPGIVGLGVAMCPKPHVSDANMAERPAEVMLALAHALAAVPPETVVEIKLRPSTDGVARCARIQLNIDKGGQ